MLSAVHSSRIGYQVAQAIGPLSGRVHYGQLGTWSPLVIESAGTDRPPSSDHADSSSTGARTIETAFSPRRNSLNFLGLVLALFVVFSHSITLGSFGSESLFDRTTLGTLAVYGFFAISGYLIAGSASRNGTGRYLWQRFLRIFPAFWVCLIVTAFVFGTIAWYHYNPERSGLCGIHCYVSQSNGPIGYVVHNALLQINQPKIAGTLPGGVWSFGWNGSLWTLEFEFLCYLLLAALSFCGLLRRRALIAVMTGIFWATEIVIISVPSLAQEFSPFNRRDMLNVLGIHVEVMRVLVLVSIFLFGALLYLYRDFVPDSGIIALLLSIIVLSGFVIPIGQKVPSYYLTGIGVTSVFLVYPLVWLGIHLPFSRIGAINDYSYGIYVYAFPVQQMLVVWKVNSWGYWPYTMLTIALIMPLAAASWWLVEKNALKLKHVRPRIRGLTLSGAWAGGGSGTARIPPEDGPGVGGDREQ